MRNREFEMDKENNKVGINVENGEIEKFDVEELLTHFQEIITRSHPKTLRRRMTIQPS